MNIAWKHLTMVRTFEQRNLIEEGKFINKQGIYMVFEDFCGIYQNKKKQGPKIDAFGKEIIDEEEKDEEEYKDDGASQFTSGSKKKSHMDQVLLKDAKVGSLIGIESHLYDDCPAVFTAKTNEKTKLLFIDKEGFDLYLKDYLLEKHRKIMNYYQRLNFIKQTKETFRGLLRLTLMSECKSVYANSCVVMQNDVCKYLYFIVNGRFTIARSLEFIEDLTEPIEHQIQFVEGVSRETQVLQARMQLMYQDPENYNCTTSRKQLQIAHLNKGKVFGDHRLEEDFELERRPGEIAEVRQREPYSIIAFNPAEIIHIERQIYAQIIEIEDLAEYTRFKTELPADVVLRKKFLQGIEWAKFKSKNEIASAQSQHAH